MDVALQLFASLVLLLFCAIIHGTGLVLTTKLFDAEEWELRRKKLASRELGIMVPMAVCLFLMHLIEIGLFAVFYLAVGAEGSFENALYHSVSAYTTLGLPDRVAQEWRLVSALEGLTGFLLIGWSAAILVTDMERVLRKRF